MSLTVLEQLSLFLFNQFQVLMVSIH